MAILTAAGLVIAGLKLRPTSPQPIVPALQDRPALEPVVDAQAAHERAPDVELHCGSGINVSSCNHVTAGSATSVEINGTVNIDLDLDKKPARAGTR